MRDIYKEITDSIVAELERGALPWLKPWRNIGGGIDTGMPCNAVSNRSYSGVNVFILWGGAMSKGYATGRWLTYKQATECGGFVRKGEHGQTIIFMKKIAKKAKADEKAESFSLMRSYTVFNVAQCDGLPAKIIEGKPLPAAPILDSMFTSFVDATHASIHHGGDKACFIPSLDAIHMPPIAAFKDTDSYKATLAHELSHWSGHESRLNRNFSGRFGDSSYAFEELIAEISSAFLCANFGIKAELRHAGYIEHWLKVLKGDNRAIFTTASQASKAADHLRAYSEAGAAEESDVESIAA